MAAGPERSAATMVAALGAMRGLPRDVRRRVCEEAWWDLRAPLRAELSGARPPRAPFSTRQYYAARGCFNCVAWSPDGRLLAAGCSDGTEDGRAAISVWDVASGPAPARACLKGGDHDPDVAGARARKGKPPCGCETTFEEEGQAFYLSAQGCPLPGHAQNVVALAFSPDGTTLLSASDDYTVRLWGGMSGPSEAWEQTGCLLAGGPPTEDGSGYGGYGPHHIAWSPDGSRVLACLAHCERRYRTFGPRVQVWDVPGPGQPPLRPSLELELQMQPPSSGRVETLVAAFEPGGGAVVASDGKRLIRWDLAGGGAQEWPMEDGNSNVYSLCISPDASHVVAYLPTASNLTVVVLRVGETGMTRVREIQTGRTGLNAISPDRQYVLVANKKGSEMWSVQTGRRVWADEDPGRRGWVHAAAFSPDGLSFAVARSCAPIEIWR